jgi:hypothetical protein
MGKQKKEKGPECGKINCKDYGKSPSDKLLNEDKSGKGRKPMLIANPTYDVVFKYLLDDNKIAKKLLSLIIGKEIITLDYKPTEIRNDLDEKSDCLNNRSLTLLHIDFSALVKLEDGTEQHIIIELQKATYFADIMRFRRYLGTQYADPENFYVENGNRIVMPIFSIYFLCDYLKHTKVPVIKVGRTYCDAATGEEITEREEFIEGLTHDSIIIQTPALKTHRRNLLEKVLSVFQAGKAGKRMIDFPEEDYHEEYREVIRRLLQAGAEKKIRDTMILEDEIIAELEGMERTIAKKDQLIEEKDQALKAKDRQLVKAAKTLAESLGISQKEAEKLLS